MQIAERNKVVLIICQGLNCHDIAREVDLRPAVFSGGSKFRSPNGT